MPKTPYLSVVIPSYNEMANIEQGALEQVIKYLQKQTYSWEVILSDDGSTDGTAAALDLFAAEHTNVKVLHNQHAGKGPTVQSGMLAAAGQWRLFTDFDQSTPLKEIEKLWPFVSEGYEVIIGSRGVSGAERNEEPFYRHLMGLGFNVIVQIFAVRGLKDTQCGFKLLSAKSTEKLFKKLVIYGRNNQVKDAFTGAFDVEVLFLAKQAGYQIREVPIIWHHNTTDRVNPVKDSVRMLRDIIRVRLAALQGKYR